MTTDWRRRFIDLAEVVATWSKDPSTQVGAVISDPKHRIVSVGFNGFPRGVKDDPTLSREEKLARMIHAEDNAMHFAYRNIEGCSLAVTHPPCSLCAAKIIRAGLVQVVFISPDDAFEGRWGESARLGMDMLREAGISYERLIL